MGPESTWRNVQIDPNSVLCRQNKLLTNQKCSQLELENNKCQECLLASVVSSNYYVISDFGQWRAGCCGDLSWNIMVGQMSLSDWICLFGLVGGDATWRVRMYGWIDLPSISCFRVLGGAGLRSKMLPEQQTNRLGRFAKRREPYRSAAATVCISRSWNASCCWLAAGR